MSDEIFLTDLRVETIIGIYAWERAQKQTIGLDLKMPADVRRAADSDHIDDTLNYKSVAKRLIAFIEQSEFQLIETLAEKIAEIVLNEFHLDWVEVHIHKPGAINGSKDVGVRIRRGLPASAGPVDVFVSLGSNVQPRENLNAALLQLTERFGPLRRSTVYRNKAVGFDGDDFLNLVAGFATSESIEDVVAGLAFVENALGRRRDDKKFGPRTLDLDLLLYGDTVLHDGHINVPRRELGKYAFMLKPLAELAGDVRDPVSGRPYARVWATAGLNEHAMTPVSLDDA